LRHILWIIYWCIQGCVMTGLWVIGHECGHGGYSSSDMINNVVGLFVHTFLLVPFFSWKISHRKHHANTANLDRDEVFVPRVFDPNRKSNRSKQIKKTVNNGDNDHPEIHIEGFMLTTRSTLQRLANIAIMLTLGWPMYLLVNTTGHRAYPKGSWVNHFIPSSPIFLPQERYLVVISDVALLVAISLLGYVGWMNGFAWLFYVYGVPYLIVNLFLVLITYLQHTDEVLPHYSGNEWDWLRGALATVDRSYGILDIVFHHIADTHVAHHLFYQIPHYHSQEATEAVKRVIGSYYRFDPTSVPKALWRSFSSCLFVSADQNGPQGVMWYKKPESYTYKKLD